MKIVLCTTPIRPVPTDYPPFGSLALIQALRSAGYDPYFYDIDGLRPSFEQVVRFFADYKPDLIAVSAVVSTAYAYVKNLSAALKEVLPGVPIVVGGNLAASAELLHKFCRVDVCAAGEGEKIIVNLARHYDARKGQPPDLAALRRINGITFLDEKGEMVFTNYEMPLSTEEFQDPDFEILEKYSKIGNFVCDPFLRPEFARDPRSYEPKRRGLKMSTVVSAKGCVARCTFCHRWDKGYRHLSTHVLIRRIQYLKDRYNVGFIAFGDENFGSDREKLDEFIEAVKPLDILYMVAGVRCRSVDLDLLKRMRDSGCVALYYGMETGSPRILQVMEKNATLDINMNAARWTSEAGLYTIFQLVLAMPGETNETIGETVDFINKVTVDRPEPPHKILSINYIQALPGTAAYEYARQKGYLGEGLAGEDRYLTMVSDIDAADDSKFINFTESPMLTVKSWRHRILFEAEANWYRARGWAKADTKLPSGEAPKERDYYTEGGYFNLKKMVHSPFMFRYLWPLRKFYYLGYAVTKDFVRLPQKMFWGFVLEYVKCLFVKKPALTDYRSLRRVMKELTPVPSNLTEESMLPLRSGR
jgi:radical SAM superfamily enzyme YgiQ (UPF0313 family)